MWTRERNTTAVCTCRIAKPVGRKASRLWKMSPTVRWRVVKRITRVITDPIKRNSLRSLNKSWKSALNFFLPMETICSSKVLELVNCIQYDRFIFKRYKNFRVWTITFKMIIIATMTSHDRPYTWNQKTNLQTWAWKAYYFKTQYSQGLQIHFHWAK